MPRPALGFAPAIVVAPSDGQPLPITETVVDPTIPAGMPTQPACDVSPREHSGSSLSEPVAGVSSPPRGAKAVVRLSCRGDTSSQGLRLIATEVPIALTYNRATHAVMLGTPDDLADFAIGFSLSEGIIDTVGDIRDLRIVSVAAGVECRMDLEPSRLDALTRRQRRLAGPSGCGLCGLDSLAAAMRPVRSVQAGITLTSPMVQTAMASMPNAQALNQATRAVHAAGFWTPAEGLIALREDVGRHNALDKLVGALAQRGVAATDGVILLSSRISVEMVQKAAMTGSSILVAVSAPTSLAIQQAAAAGLTLIGVARPDGFEVFTHPERIRISDVA